MTAVVALGVALSGFCAAPAHAETVVASIDSDTTWTAAGNPYILAGGAVAAGATLTIEPGVEVRVTPQPDPNLNKARLTVYGRIVAQGTASDPIVFRSGSESPAAGDWEGILIRDAAAASTFDHVRMTDAWVPIEALNSDVSVTNSFFRDAEVAVSLENNIPTTGGLCSARSWATTIANNIVYDTASAFSLGATCGSPSGTVAITDNRVFRSRGDGVMVQFSSTLAVTLARNLVQNGYRGIYAYDSARFGSSSGAIHLDDNTVVGNQQGMVAGTGPGGTVTAAGNTLRDNVVFDFANWGNTDLSVPNNWWGTTDTQGLAARIQDRADEPSLGAVTFDPVSSQSSPDAPTFDATAPHTSSDAGPQSPTAQRAATFTGFTTSKPGANAIFECQLDENPWKKCQSGVSYTGLIDGGHEFRVRAVDDSGNADPSPVIRTWTVDSRPPDTLLRDAPEDLAVTSEATFGFGATESASGYECRLDGADWHRCTAPWTVRGLGDGVHTFAVRAIDGAGNVDPSPASRSWTVDTGTKPAARLSASANPVQAGQPVTFDASGSTSGRGGAISRYEWDLDGDGSFETDGAAVATTTHAFATAGTFTVAVRVTDRGGLSSATSVSVDVRPVPPPGELGVSINHGAIATNNPNVTLSVIWPRLAASALVSNDGGFGLAGSTSTFSLAAEIPWRLASSGPERMPKIAYVRFRGGESGRETYTDDIILDERSPKVIAASLRASTGGSVRMARVQRARVTFRASDDNSGLAAVQVSADRKPSGKRITTVRLVAKNRKGKRLLSKRVSVRVASRRLWIRVQDTGGNYSRWRKVH